MPKCKDKCNLLTIRMYNNNNKYNHNINISNNILYKLCNKHTNNLNNNLEI